MRIVLQKSYDAEKQRFLWQINVWKIANKPAPIKIKGEIFTKGVELTCPYQVEITLTTLVKHYGLKIEDVISINHNREVREFEE